MERTVTKWNLRRDIRFNTCVISLTWQEDLGKWKIRVRHADQERDEHADILVSARGFLSHWEWPDITGIHDFKGQKCHSAAWDQEYDYSGKRIGIIGNGSSAIQILPQMAKLKGTTVVSFQRGPTWITQSLGQALGVPEHDDSVGIDENENGIPEVTNGDVGVDMAEVDEEDEEVGSNFNPRYTAKEKRRFQSKQKHQAYRKTLQHGMNKGFRLVGTPLTPPTHALNVTDSEAPVPERLD
jgi:hypothetical protein